MPVDIGCFVSIFKLISLMDPYNSTFKKRRRGHGQATFRNY
jgi:hypothetical protein